MASKKSGSKPVAQSTVEERPEAKRPEEKSPDETTRIKILDSTIACINRWGIEKTSLTNIADEAGIARSTVYIYFSSRDDVIESAMLHSGDSFMHMLLEHVERFRSPADRLVEAFLYLINNIAQQSFLKAVSATDPSKVIVKVTNGLKGEAGRKLAKTVVSICLKDREDLLKEIDEIADFCIGIAFYLLITFELRSAKATKALLKKRLLPALGL